MDPDTFFSLVPTPYCDTTGLSYKQAGDSMDKGGSDIGTSVSVESLGEEAAFNRSKILH